MTNTREATRSDEEEIANVGAHDNLDPSQDNQVPPLEKIPMGGKVTVVPPPIIMEK